MTLLSGVVSPLASIQGGTLTPVFGLLIDTALKGSLLIVAAAIAAYMLHGRSAASRHAAWSTAVVGHLALPIVTLLAPQWRLPVLPAPPWLDVAAVAPALSASTPVAAPAPSGSSAPAQNVEPRSVQPGPSAENATGTTPPGAGVASVVGTSEEAGKGRTGIRAWPSLSILGILWILGTLFVLARLAFGTWRVGRLAKQGYRVADGEWLALAQRLANRLGITRPLTLLRGESLAVPVTWGVVYPAVLLPPDSDEWPEARRRFVLVHEMAHVKRFDALTQLLAQFAIAILWFDPLIWLAAHRMRVEREHACDDYVLRDGTAPSLYAGELLEMVQSIGSPKHESAAPAFAALAMARRSEFEGRMLAILDPKQERHTLGRRSTIAASVALALLVIPLAALRPFQNPPAIGRAGVHVVEPKAPLTSKSYVLQFGDDACDSAWKAGKHGTSVHSHVDDSNDNSFIEYFITGEQRCLQAAIIGKAAFYDDRLTALPDDAYVFFNEVTAAGSRTVKVTSDNGALRYAAKLNRKPVPFDDAMRSWLGQVMPEVLRDASIEVPARVARDMKAGGVDAVLRDIASIESNAAKTTHYQALLKTPALTSREYDRIARQAGKELASSPSDLDAVLMSIAGTPGSATRSIERAAGKLAAAQATMATALGTALEHNSSSADSAATYKQYAETDDPDVILVALRGVHDISSDTEKRTLLQSIAPKILGRRDARFRTAFFSAAGSIESDTDLRILLQDALEYGHADPAITLAVFDLVGRSMESDSDRRITLTSAAEKHLLTSSVLRDAYAAAAKKMTSSTDYVITMQAAIKQ